MQSRIIGRFRLVLVVALAFWLPVRCLPSFFVGVFSARTRLPSDSQDALVVRLSGGLMERVRTPGCRILIPSKRGDVRVVENALPSIGVTSTSSTAANLASKERDGGSLAPELFVQLGTGAEDAPPSKPTGFTAVAITSSQVDLNWGASTANVGVTGYTIYRDGSELYIVGGSALTYQESEVTYGNAPESNAHHVGSSGSTSAGIRTEVDITALVHGDGPLSLAMTSTSTAAANIASKEQEGGSLAPWIIVEFDGCGEDTSLPSTPTGLTATAITPGEGGETSYTFTPVADAQVREVEPTRNYGNSTSVRTDATPIINSYLTFDAPEEWIEIDVTPYVQGDGTTSLAMTSASVTATNFDSRESGETAPQLIIETGP